MSFSFLQQTSFPFPSESSSWQTVVPPPLLSLLWEVRTSRLLGSNLARGLIQGS